jgi:hypothetical protein
MRLLVTLIVFAGVLAGITVASEPFPYLPVQIVTESGDNRDDALDEVNAKRATRRMPPYVRDEGLTIAARAAAKYRADHLLFGHVSDTNLGDFRFLPAGVSIKGVAGGCAAYPASYGWMSCCTFDNYTYCGAAWAPGRDGKRYCHLFVR